jgi:hypothetical protein
MSDEGARRLAGVAPVCETDRIDDAKRISQLRVDEQEAIITGLQRKVDKAKNLKIALERSLGSELSRDETISLIKTRFEDGKVESLLADEIWEDQIAIMEIR